MPQTNLYVGSKDPLFDDCVRFFENLLSSGVETKFYNYKYLIHGILSDSVKEDYKSK